ncbi:hypothetical protein C3469_12635 [Mycobacterium kansasii]|nr:hypothetical protein C3B43_12220 [Mycobacterium kansasii]POY00919.1 hypothetical protein C3479_14045 [Mycobacterium kansasii]POY06321.1 hypothetical protein C3477_10920 [Mycobacterium kansasii]POY20436.1 hypothetical protein C3476_15500 [Mycobacterium kansasii]POY27115.1 hypothetical protein C3469_12635 [Mycobacterium kansasii]
MPATLSQIRAWSTEHLIDAAGYWTQTADHWEDVFLQEYRPRASEPSKVRSAELSWAALASS